jgi:hypothetical protein
VADCRRRAMRAGADPARRPPALGLPAASLARRRCKPRSPSAAPVRARRLATAIAVLAVKSRRMRSIRPPPRRCALRSRTLTAARGDGRWVSKSRGRRKAAVGRFRSATRLDSSLPRRPSAGARRAEAKLKERRSRLTATGRRGRRGSGELRP